MNSAELQELITHLKSDDKVEHAYKYSNKTIYQCNQTDSLYKEHSDHFKLLGLIFLMYTGATYNYVGVWWSLIPGYLFLSSALTLYILKSIATSYIVRIDLVDNY